MFSYNWLFINDILQKCFRKSRDNWESYSLNSKTKVTLTPSGNIQKNPGFTKLMVSLLTDFTPFLIRFSKLFTKHINIILIFEYSLQEKYFVGYFECQNISINVHKTKRYRHEVYKVISNIMKLAKYFFCNYDLIYIYTEYSQTDLMSC